MAIEYLHSNKIIMRDIKSVNIMIDSNGRTKMVDLGLSKNLIGATEECMTYCGTPEYMAPEICILSMDSSTIARKHPHYDRGFYSYEVDFWSMGVTMYEMAMSGEMPFRESEDPDMRVTVASNAIVG